MGLQPGTRVAVLAATTPDHLSFMYAVSWAGGVLSPADVRVTGEVTLLPAGMGQVVEAVVMVLALQQVLEEQGVVVMAVVLKPVQ